MERWGVIKGAGSNQLSTKKWDGKTYVTEDSVRGKAYVLTSSDFFP